MNPCLLCCPALLVLAFNLSTHAQAIFTDTEVEAIDTLVHKHFDSTNAAMVVGLIDRQRSKIISAGKLDNGADTRPDGDTLFVIGSCTKTFTVLLLADMVQRGQMKLDDPVANYLPASVKVPTKGGKQITLLNLAA